MRSGAQRGWWLTRLTAVAIAACGGSAQPRPTIRVQPPAPAAGLLVPPSLPVRSSVLALAIEAELETVRAQIEAALPRAQNQDWQRVTREGADQRVELRIFVERDPVQLSFADGALRTEVPLRYWADARGEVKSPLPWHKNRWFEIEPGSWGTRLAPQRVALVVHTKVELGGDGRLNVQSRMEPVQPGPAPSGSFCVRAGIELCVGKQTFEGQVRDAFRQRVEPELQSAVAALDQRLEREVDLRRRLEQAWHAMRCPIALHRGAAATCTPEPGEQGLWLQLVPQRVVAGELAQKKERLQVRVELDGSVQLVRGPAPAIAAAPLPVIERGKPERDYALSAEVALPYAALSAQLAAAVRSAQIELGPHGKAELTAARIAAAIAGGKNGRVLLELRLAGDADAVFYAYAEPKSERKQLAFVRLHVTPESEHALAQALPELDQAAFSRALERALIIRFDAISQLLATAADAAVEAGLPHVQPTTTVTRLELTDLRLGPDAVLAQLTLYGRIRLLLAP